MELVIASNNKGKIREIRELLPELELLSLADVGFTEDIPEPWHTFEENALAKAAAVHRFCGKNIFADDSGICVRALDGRPGVDSAHFSGDRDDEQNLQHLLHELKDKEDRTAFYKAVICLIWDSEVYYFDGICEGQIVAEKRGDGGFGYDPVFVPDGFSETFGELSSAVKNSISHRARAVSRMAEFVKSKAAN